MSPYNRRSFRRFWDSLNVRDCPRAVLIRKVEKILSRVDGLVVGH